MQKKITFSEFQERYKGDGLGYDGDIGIRFDVDPNEDGSLEISIFAFEVWRTTDHKFFNILVSYENIEDLKIILSKIERESELYLSKIKSQIAKFLT
jgi:hypothetical protein